MRRLPPLGALRAFEAAARLGSFRRAADELHVTPTAISHQVRGLEALCGQALFRRRPLVLSEAGALLYPVLRDGFDRFAAAFSDLRGDRTQRVLRVTATNAFAARCLVPLLPGWRAANPAVELEVIGTDAVLDLPGGKIDVALRYARTAPADGAATELVRDRFHAMSIPALLSATDWQDLPRIAYDWPADDRMAPTWERFAAASGAVRTRRAPLRFREELHAIEAVVAGQGVAILSDVLLKRELASGAVVIVSPVGLDGYGVYIVTRPGNPDVRDFTGWLRAAFRG